MAAADICIHTPAVGVSAKELERNLRQNFHAGIDTLLDDVWIKSVNGVVNVEEFKLAISELEQPGGFVDSLVESSLQKWAEFRRSSTHKANLLEAVSA